MFQVVPKKVIVSIGLDLSLTGTGVVVLTNGKMTKQTLIKSKPSGPKTIDELKRIRKIVQSIEEIVSEEMPDIAVIEGLAFMAKGTSLVQLSALNYMVRAILFDYHVPFLIVAPTSLKKFITGNGAAKKDVMMMETFKRYGVTLTDDNVMDAYGLAHVGLAHAGGNSKAITKLQTEVLKLLEKQL